MNCPCEVPSAIGGCLGIGGITKRIFCHCEEFFLEEERRSNLLVVVDIEKAMRLLRFARNDIE